MLKASDVQTKSLSLEGAIALAEIYEEHFDRIWHWLHGMGVRDADLEDATQEVFVVVHRKLAQFEGRSRLTTWLYGIASRVAASFRRKGAARREASSDDLEPIVDTVIGPDAAAADREGRAILDQILAGLDPKKRSVFVLYELDDMTLQEISELLDTPLQTVYSRLTAARLHFRAEAARMTQPKESRR